jgi:hypothetical protein
LSGGGARRENQQSANRETKLRTMDAQTATRAARLVRLAAAALACGFLATPALAERTDVVVLDNGDRITGEVLQLASGQLKFKTDHLGTLYIDWTHIVSLTTAQRLNIELLDGKRLHGAAPDAASSAGAIRLLSEQPGQAPAPTEVPITDVADLRRITAGDVWYHRLDGDVSLGYSYTSANGVQTADFSGNVGTRNSKREWKISLDMEMTHQDTAPSTQRDSLVLSIDTFLPNRYYRETELQFERNEELGLDLRSLIAQTFGRYFVQRQGFEWRAGAGLAVSTETGSNGDKRQAVWVPLTTDLYMFRWDHPKTNVAANLAVLPALNEGGRVRGQASLKLKHELINDLFLEISFSDSYDNQPAETARTNDWNVVTSLGYSF